MTARLSPQREAVIVERAAKRAAEFTEWLNRYSPMPGQEIANRAEAVLEEDVPALLAELAAARAERDEMQLRVDEVERRYTFDTADLRRAVDHHKGGKERWRKRALKAEPERDALQERLHQAALAKVWTNEDRKKFVFVEDIAPALLGLGQSTDEHFGDCHANVDGHRMVNDHCLYCSKSTQEVRS